VYWCVLYDSQTDYFCYGIKPLVFVGTINTQKQVEARISFCGYVIAELIQHSWVSTVCEEFGQHGSSYV
jgi:hypothetical protein